MPAKLSITDLAAVDTAEGRRYYGDVRPDLEARFAAALDAALDRIADQPELFAPLSQTFARFASRRSRTRLSTECDRPTWTSSASSMTSVTSSVCGPGCDAAVARRRRPG